MLNHYDPCVENNLIKGKQCTIVWHVDDLKLSHNQIKVVDKVVKWLIYKYEDAKIGIMIPIRRTRHEYLLMMFDLNEKVAVKIDMVDYVEKMIQDFPVNLKNTKKVSSPESEYIFKVHKSATNINQSKVEIFYNMVERGLFPTKRARVDIHPTIAFLSTRVKN